MRCRLGLLLCGFEGGVIAPVEAPEHMQQFLDVYPAEVRSHFSNGHMPTPVFCYILLSPCTAARNRCSKYNSDCDPRPLPFIFVNLEMFLRAGPWVALGRSAGWFAHACIGTANPKLFPSLRRVLGKRVGEEEHSMLNR